MGQLEQCTKMVLPTPPEEAQAFMAQLEQCTKMVLPTPPEEAQAFVAQYPGLDPTIVERFLSMDPRLQRNVMAKSLDDARDVTAVLIKRVANALHMKNGDWICPQCYDIQFASKQQCSQCGMPRPQ